VGTWERTHSDDYELWLETPAGDRERAEAAIALFSSDPEAALRVFVDLAEGGMAWAMETVADYYAHGTAVAADFERSQDYYCRAIHAGSWMATLGYAKLLAGHGYFDECETLLRDGVEQDFIPAYFWLAWYRLKQSPDAATRRAVRPLFERAAEAGHPAAEMHLARMRLSGRFGLREIPAGIRAFLRVSERSRVEAEVEKDAHSQQVQAVG